jgi:hypothetical protein
MKSLHFRYGYEVYQLRRMDEGYPVSWLRWFGPVEPIVSMGWHMMLDVPRWFRYAQASGLPAWKALGVLPLLLLISSFARSCEMVGMYSTMLWPVSMRSWAENV